MWWLSRALAASWVPQVVGSFTEAQAPVAGFTGRLARWLTHLGRASISAGIGHASGCARLRARCAATRQRVEQKRVPARFEALISRPHPVRWHVLTDTIVTRKPLRLLGFLGRVVGVAGVGPPPKDPSRRARRNKDAVVLRVVPARPVEQPPLPTFYVTVPGSDGHERRRLFRWPAATRAWWRMWGRSPLAAEFTETDWSFLLDTALLHAAVWRGEYRYGPELRLRVAKFGATPEDRARLRITFAVADDVEASGTRPEEPAPGGARSRSRSRSLRAADGT